jgi:hypothetical protein
MELLALWGAVTGTAGAGIALRREFLAGRRRLAVAPTVNFSISRVEPVGALLQGWAAVAAWNTGGRSLAIERVGFQYLAVVRGTEEVRVMRAMIHMERPVTAAVDGPTQKIYTPLGPMLAGGINPFDMVEALVVTTGGREWFSPAQPLIQSVPTLVGPDLFKTGLEQLRNEAEAPPQAGDELALLQEDPFLPDEVHPN